MPLEKTNPQTEEFNIAVQQRMEEMHKQMLSSVSHDLKTPLASIIGSLEIHQRLGHNLTPEKKAELIEMALQEAYRLDNFITNILDIAKFESGMVRPRLEDTNIGALVSQALKKLDYRLKQASLSVQPAGSSQAGTLLDAALLTRALVLMLDNAVKFGPKEGLAITISYGTENGRFWLEVQDNGPGIPAGQEEHIFDKYVRITRQDTQNAGTGLGLSIVRAIATLQQGTITAKNASGGGALFRLDIPLTAAA